jgi:hypothetical protein
MSADNVQNIFGAHNFFRDRDPIENPVWAENLLAPYSIGHYLREFGSKRHVPQLIFEIIGDEGEEMLGFRFYVDGNEVSPDGIISPFELLRATRASGEFYIHTCTCHIPECAGIWGGTVMAHDLQRGVVIWRTDTSELKSLFIFERQAFCSEVLRACHEAIKFLEASPQRILEMEEVNVGTLRSATRQAEEKLAAQRARSRHDSPHEQCLRGGARQN